MNRYDAATCPAVVSARCELYEYLLVRLEIAFAAQAICGGISRPCRELPSTLIHFTYQYMDHTDSPERLGLKI